MKNPKIKLDRVSRRDFVKTSAAVVGSLVASQFPESASAFYPSEDAIRIGLIRFALRDCRV